MYDEFSIFLQNKKYIADYKIFHIWTHKQFFIISGV